MCSSQYRFAASSSITSVAPPPTASTRASRHSRSTGVPRHVAHAAVELLAGLHDFVDQFAGQRLQQRHVLHHVVALRHAPGAVVGVLARGARPGVAHRQALAHRLLVPQRAAEGLARLARGPASAAAPACSGPPPSRPARCARSGSSSSPRRSPCPPRRAGGPAGTRQSSKCSSAVSEQRQPVLSSWRPTLKPGVPFSTAKIEMSRWPGPVRAATKTRSACTPLVMNSLLPLITQCVAVAARVGAQAGDVGAGAGLGDADRGDQFAARDARHPARLLRARCRRGAGAGWPCRCAPAR